MAILSKDCKPNNFDSHYSPKLCFTDIRGPCWKFVECESFLPWIKLSGHPSSIWDKRGWLNWFWQLLCDGLSSFNLKAFYYALLYMHRLAVYMKEGVPFAHDLSLENSADSTLCFRMALLHSVSYLLFLFPSSSLFTVFDSISSNIDEVLSINTSVNMFVFGDF